MSNPEYLYFSQMSDSGREKLEELINMAWRKLMDIAESPHAAKENLMKTDFKVASAAVALVGRVLQAETAMHQAMAVNANLAATSKKAREILAANLPSLKLPA